MNIDPFAVFEEWLTRVDSHDGRLRRCIKNQSQEDEFDILALLPIPPGQRIFYVADLRALVEAGKEWREAEARVAELEALVTRYAACYICRGTPLTGHSGHCSRPFFGPPRQDDTKKAEVRVAELEELLRAAFDRIGQQSELLSRKAEVNHASANTRTR